MDSVRSVRASEYSENACMHVCGMYALSLNSSSLHRGTQYAPAQAALIMRWCEAQSDMRVDWCSAADAAAAATAGSAVGRSAVAWGPRWATGQTADREGGRAIP